MKQLARALLAVGSMVSALAACAPDPAGSAADAAALPEASTLPASDAAVPDGAPVATLPDGAADGGVDASLRDAADGAAGCGASAARLCALGEGCGAAADCAAPNVCTSGVCATPCPPGTFSSAGACTPCARGRYSEVAGSLACTACADNSSTAAVGSTSVAACVPCPVGEVANAATNHLCTSFDGRVSSGSAAGPVVHANNGGWSGAASSRSGNYFVTGSKTGAVISISWSSSGAIVEGSPVAGLVKVTSTTGAYMWSEAAASRPTVLITSWNPATRAVRLTASGSLVRTNGAPLSNPSFVATFAGILP